jgi:hypothetical protein
VLLRTSGNTGHGIGTPLDAAIEQDVDLYSFLFHELGVKFRSRNQSFLSPPDVQGTVHLQRRAPSCGQVATVFHDHFKCGHSTASLPKF